MVVTYRAHSSEQALPSVIDLNHVLNATSRILWKTSIHCRSSRETGMSEYQISAGMKNGSTEQHPDMEPIVDAYTRLSELRADPDAIAHAFESGEYHYKSLIKREVYERNKAEL